MQERTCSERIAEHYQDRMADLRYLWELYKRDPDAQDKDLGWWPEYGLCFEYVPPNTFGDQTRGFFRYQLSTGGPGDEFRFYCDENVNPVEIQYWFLDWFDGASFTLEGEDEAMLMEIFEEFKESGMVEQELENAR